MKTAKITTSLSLFPLIALCLVMIYYSAIYGMSSLYQVGLENELDRYTEFMFDSDPNAADFAEKAQQKRDTINELGARLFDFNANNPDVLALLAYVETNNYWDGMAPQQALQRSSELHRLASETRPIGYDTYAEEAFTKLYQQQDFSQVLAQLELAQRFGPFESSTARAGIEILFDHWSELNREQRLQAMDYLTSHQKYGIDRKELNQLVEHSVHKEKLCNVARFVQLSLRTCR